jgi:hypothetical protein
MRPVSPEVVFINDNFRNISRLLLNAIHKRVFPLDFTLAIDFSSPDFFCRRVQNYVFHATGERRGACLISKFSCRPIKAFPWFHPAN